MAEAVPFLKTTMRLLYNRPDIVHSCVRPRVSKYDQEYWSQNIRKVNKLWQPGHIRHEYIEGLIQDNDPVENSTVHQYLLFDVHYYLASFKPANVKTCDMYRAVGGNFFGMPGKYTLPFSEGHYVIGGDATVTMWSRRSNLFYKHDLVTLSGAHTCVDLGWYSIVVASGVSRNLEIIKARPTGYCPTNSVQSTWLLMQYSGM